MLKRLWERFQGLIIIALVIFLFWLILQPSDNIAKKLIYGNTTKKILVIENGEVAAEYNDDMGMTFGVDY